MYPHFARFFNLLIILVAFSKGFKIYFFTLLTEPPVHCWGHGTPITTPQPPHHYPYDWRVLIPCISYFWKTWVRPCILVGSGTIPPPATLPLTLWWMRVNTSCIISQLACIWTCSITSKIISLFICPYVHFKDNTLYMYHNVFVWLGTILRRMSHIPQSISLAQCDNIGD